MTSSEAARDGDLLSIGDLADAVGLSADTIRAWERRYGRPAAIRLPSGHRRYAAATVPWLRRIAEALALGHRPSKVLSLSDDELERLVAPGPAGLEPGLAAILEHVRGFERDAVRDALLAAWAGSPGEAFLIETIAPLLDAAGRAWADGEIDVRHEHFLSEIVEDVLRAIRGELGEPAGPVVLLTTLPDELHDLGLQMAALVCALHGVRARILGTHTPLPEIVAAAADLRPTAVGISVSLATGGPHTDRRLRELRAELDPSIAVVVGGAGARRGRRGPSGIDYVATLSDFGRWLDERIRAG